MLHAWIHRNRPNADHAAPAWLSPTDRQQAARLVAQEWDAEQAGTIAMATGDWIAAADLEEERVVRQDELAQFLLGTEVLAPTKGGGCQAN
jgi:hypothetical protein